MYGLWFIFFGVLALLILCFILIIIGTKRVERNFDGMSLTLIIGAFGSFISGIAALILLLCSIFGPICAKRDLTRQELYYETIYQRYIEQLKDNGNNTDYGDFASNPDYLEKISDFEEWTINAYTSVKIYGQFSKYYFVADRVETLYNKLEN